jgi:hypothetical protein
MKVRLRPNLRFFDDFDSDFNITSKQTSVSVPARSLQSYAIKSGLMKGDLIPTSGECSFFFKGAFVVFSSSFPQKMYFYENGLTFVRDTETLKSQSLTSVPSVIAKVMAQNGIMVIEDTTSSKKTAKKAVVA